MIKLVYCFRRRPDLDAREFRRYWREVHGPIASRIPGLRRLVQSHRVAVAGDARGGDFDGMAELWFDDAEALLAARRSPEWAASGADEANFLDPGSAVYFVSEEAEVPIPGARRAGA